MSFWRRNRNRLLASVAAGAAGAAAAYYWWTYESEEAAEARRRREAALAELQSIVHGDRRRGAPATGAGGGGGVGSAQQQQQDVGAKEASLDDSLQAHFDSIQALSERQALEDLLPRLRAALFAATDYDPLRERLRGPGLGPAEKRALWGQLASLAFARAMGGVWLVPLLDLLVRLKLHIVARHMYLEVQLPGIAPRGGAGGGGGGSWGGGLGRGGLGRGGLPPRLSDKAKEEFFRSDFFIDAGAAGLLHRLRRAADAALSAVDLAGAAGPGDVERLVIAAHARFEAEFTRRGDVWHAYLVPPGAPPAAQHAGVGGAPPLSPVEALMVEELNRELRDVVGGYRFMEALRSEVRHTSRVMGTYVTAKLVGTAPGQPQQQQQHTGGASAGDIPASSQQQQQQQPGEAASGGESSRGGAGAGGSASGGAPQARPFPFVVPIVAKSTNVLFDEASRCTRGLSSLHEVQALCASVFTYGSHIQDGLDRCA